MLFVITIVITMKHQVEFPYLCYEVSLYVNVMADGASFCCFVDF